MTDDDDDIMKNIFEGCSVRTFSKKRRHVAQNGITKSIAPPIATGWLFLCKLDGSVSFNCCHPSYNG
jgi:NADH:ubiquinone oxidoreductase subunit